MRPPDSAVRERARRGDRDDAVPLLRAAVDNLGTRWTNEQLMFHMVFGYMVVQRLLLLVRLFGPLPRRISRGYACVLDAATAPFDVINYYGSRMAARVYNRKRMGAKLNRVIDALEQSLSRDDEDALRRGDQA